VTPAILQKMMSDPDLVKVRRVLHAFLRMKKYDIAALKRAYAGEPSVRD
jgi:predicted 3-demethylubiquinone-9 3-methyltransferase (glyoxalase superfamily)